MRVEGLLNIIMSPRQRSHDVPPPKDRSGKIIIKLPESKVRIPKALREAAWAGKAGPMSGRKRPEEDPDFLNVVEAEEMTPELKQERLLFLVEDFNLWSRNEYLEEFVGLSVHNKSEKMQELIRHELENPDNEASRSALEAWQKELEELGL